MLTNQDTAKIISMYFPLRLVHETYNATCESSFAIRAAITHEISEIEGYKLPLVPLALITDEHAVQVARLAFSVKSKWKPKDGRDYLNDIYSNGFSRTSNWYILQYLIQQGYAVPLWLGNNHEANGKTAIELGIAIDKTKLKK